MAMITAVPARPTIATRLLPKRAPMEPLKRRLTPYVTRNVVSRNPRSCVGKCSRRWNSPLTATYASRDAWNDAHAMYVTMTIRYLRMPGGGGDAASETDMRERRKRYREGNRGGAGLEVARRGAPVRCADPSRGRGERASLDGDAARSTVGVRAEQACASRCARATRPFEGCDNTHDRSTLATTPLVWGRAVSFLGFGPFRVDRSSRSTRAVRTTVSTARAREFERRISIGAD